MSATLSKIKRRAEQLTATVFLRADCDKYFCAARLTATAYPSNGIAVSGMTGTTTRVAILHGLSPYRLHPFWIFCWLDRRAEIYLSFGRAGFVRIKTGVYTFADDAASVSESKFIVPGKPVNIGLTGDTFPAPAPRRHYEFDGVCRKFQRRITERRVVVVRR